ncbi:MAG: hypothetical protein R3D26_08755 [Cyanobacteriota/Melainabacteria group bacterium]
MRTSAEPEAVHKGDVRVVAPGTDLNMVLSTELKLWQNVEGDEFFGKIIKDVLVDGQVVIPRGTTVHGVLSIIQGPKRAENDLAISIRFDYLITPDGQ